LPSSKNGIVTSFGLQYGGSAPEVSKALVQLIFSWPVLSGEEIGLQIGDKDGK